MTSKHAVLGTGQRKPIFSERIAKAELRAMLSRREAESMMTKTGALYAIAARMCLETDGDHAKELFAESGSAFEKGQSYMFAFQSYLNADKFSDVRRIIKDLPEDDMIKGLRISMPDLTGALFEKIKTFEGLPEGSRGEQRAVIDLKAAMKDILTPFAEAVERLFKTIERE